MNVVSNLKISFRGYVAQPVCNWCCCIARAVFVLFSYMRDVCLGLWRWYRPPPDPVVVPGSWVKDRVVLLIAQGDGFILCATRYCTYGWGRNNRGQLGVGDTNNRSMPTLIRGLWGKAITGLAAGAAHALVIADRQVWTFGSGNKGQLGHGAHDDCLVPTLVGALADKVSVAVAAGYAHSAVLTIDGAVFIFGWRTTQMGSCAPTERCIPESVDLGGVTPTVFSSSEYYTMAGSSTGEVFIDNSYSFDKPPKFGNLIDAIEARNGSSCSVFSDGKLYIPSLLRNVYKWDPVPDFPGQAISSFSSFDDRCWAIIANQKLYIRGNCLAVGLHRFLWSGGQCDEGRRVSLPRADRGSIYLQYRMRALDPYRMRTVALGIHNMFASSCEGQLFSAGSNYYGQLGRGTTDPEPGNQSPVAVVDIPVPYLNPYSVRDESATPIPDTLEDAAILSLGSLLVTNVSWVFRNMDDIGVDVLTYLPDRVEDPYS